jgi:hypothetical protein
MSVDNALASALEDLTLAPLDSHGEALEDSLIAGYSLPENGASGTASPYCWVCCCCCSCDIG